MNYYNSFPDERGYFGEFGGRFVPETIMPAIIELEKAYNKLANTQEFKSTLAEFLKYWVGRPSSLYYAENLSNYLSGPEIYLKREDLNHTGAHKINNALGQILLARHMGKKRIIAETGAGQHGVATASVAARFGMECVVYMGSEDIERQKPNVFRMELGAEVRAVNSGTKTLKDATNEAIRDWVGNVRDTHYIIGSVVGPHPYPMIVRDFQRIIGDELKEQSIKQLGKMPDAIIACVGGGSNAIGIFYPFLEDKDVRLIGVEAAGEGIETKKHAASITRGKIGVLHGSKMDLLQTAEGQITPTHSISAGLDYPGVGPEHSYLNQIKRVEYGFADDQSALKAFELLSAKEGIIPALETAHAIAFLVNNIGSFEKEEKVVINLSGRVTRIWSQYGNIWRKKLSRIKSIFTKRLASNKKVNIAYITPDYPYDDFTVALTLMLADNNVQIVEIGVPFSDPLADGPIIQNSSYKALKKQINLKKILSDVKRIRDSCEVGIVLMTYINPVLAYGIENFLNDAKEAGVDGLIVPDLPVDEIDFISSKIDAKNLDLILLAAPTSPKERLKKIASNSRGFIYCVSVTGVTGIRKTNFIESDTITFLNRIKSISDLPVALGFGLSQPEQIKKLSLHTDGFIIGSALINSLENAAGKDEALNSAQKFIRHVYSD